jgi:hypothetical protein
MKARLKLRAILTFIRRAYARRIRAGRINGLLLLKTLALPARRSAGLDHRVKFSATRAGARGTEVRALKTFAVAHVLAAVPVLGLREPGHSRQRNDDDRRSDQR